MVHSKQLTADNSFNTSTTHTHTCTTCDSNTYRDGCTHIQCIDGTQLIDAFIRFDADRWFICTHTYTIHLCQCEGDCSFVHSYTHIFATHKTTHRMHDDTRTHAHTQINNVKRTVRTSSNSSISPLLLANDDLESMLPWQRPKHTRQYLAQ